MRSSTDVIDFSRSFLTWRIDWLKKPGETVSQKPVFTVNNARIQVDCRCQITDNDSGKSEEFLLGANCKTERVGVERGIWTQPNADFVPVFSRERFLNLKTFDRVGREVMLYPPSKGSQPVCQTGSVAEAFDSVRIELVYKAAELLEAPEEVVSAVLKDQPLVARTQIEQGRYRTLLDYPIKVINANERDQFYQTDTGPVLMPDFNREPEDMIAGFELAFAAFNSPDCTEFIVRVPTPVCEETSVYHYSQPLRFEARNQIFRLIDD